MHKFTKFLPMLIAFAAIFPVMWGGRALADTVARSIEAAVDDASSDPNLRFSVSGAPDGRGNLWIGTEGKGVWRGGADGTRFFTTADGLGDDDVYAVAADRKGRVWLGHSSHGVSVYNGKTWRNYGAVDGPVGSRVFAIAVCPTDGDVWIATESGLARYSQDGDRWSWFNRSNGLPDDQVSSMAFDGTGNLYVGLQCDGVAVAKAADQYTKWRSQTGPDVMPKAAQGSGLPGPLVNAMLVSRAGVVYAGTPRGIAWSRDQGENWQFLRGTNWAALVAGSFDGAPKDMVASRTPLKEDWISCLGQDSQGNILVGHREKGYEILSPDKLDFIEGGGGKVRAIIPLPDESFVLCGFNQGLTYSPGLGAQTDAAPVPPAPPAAFPSIAKPATGDELDRMRKQIVALPPATSNIEILDDDWESKGDWIGRYGREFSLFNGYNWGNAAGGGNPYSVSICTGPYALDANVYSFETYLSKIQFPENVLFNPSRHRRVPGEFNDGSFDPKRFPHDKEGPDLFTAVRVPAGNHRVSLYFFNNDGHAPGVNTNRDYYLQVKIPGVRAAGKRNLVDDGSDRNEGFVVPGSAAIDAELSDTVARLRVPTFWNGCYKRLLVRGPANIWIKIGRNYSYVTKFQGVFVDGEGDAAAAEDANPIRLNGLPDVHVPRTDTDPTLLPGITGAAAKLWAAVDASSGREGYAAYERPLRLAAYRAAAASGETDPKLLENWRWRLSLWNDADRQLIDSMIPSPGQAGDN